MRIWRSDLYKQEYLFEIKCMRYRKRVKICTWLFSHKSVSVWSNYFLLLFLILYNISTYFNININIYSTIVTAFTGSIIETLFIFKFKVFCEWRYVVCRNVPTFQRNLLHPSFEFYLLGHLSSCLSVWIFRLPNYFTIPQKYIPYMFIIAVWHM
jgi:hypothetical protein